MPGLLTLKTNLKSLKYGSDQPGGGDSGQPYVKIPIPDTIISAPDDGLIRDGMVNAIAHSAVDLFRIGKFFTDFPKGPLFLAKQIGLQLSNPAIETKNISIGNGQGILGTIGDALSELNNTFGPTRIYNAGINTLAQIGVEAFGEHFNRHGLTPDQDDSTKYESVVTYNNQNDNNRLVNLTNKLIGDSTSSLAVGGVLENIANVPNSGFNLTAPQFEINSYLGGPDSTYGVGRTIIKRTTFTVTPTEAILDKKNIDQVINSINYVNTLGLSKQYFGTSSLDVDFNRPTIKPSDLDLTTYSTTNINQIVLDNNPNPIITSSPNINLPANYQTYQNIINSRLLREQNYISSSIPLNQFNIFLTGSDGKNLTGHFSPVKQPIIGYYNGYGDTVFLKTNGGWNTINRHARIGSGRQDEINLTPLFSSDSPPGTKVNIGGVVHNVRDLVKFRIEAINTDNPSNAIWMVFRAYLKGFQDSYSSEWGDVKYIGRGEKFYVYSGFSRTITYNFKVAALSAPEMEIMYQKLNFLASNMTPDYGHNNLMRGPLLRTTIGDYIYREPGFITSLQYSIADDTPWEIGLDEPEGGFASNMYDLPHIIDVSVNYTIIHQNLPRKNAKTPFIMNRAPNNFWIDDINIKQGNPV